MRTLILLTVALPAFAGGFYLTVQPTPSNGLTAQLRGCHQAEKGELTATAETIAGGKRQTIQLKISKRENPGLFAVELAPSMKGHWVITLSAKHPDVPMTARLTVPVVDGQPDTAHAK